MGRWITRDPLTWGPDDKRLLAVRGTPFYPIVKEIVSSVGSLNPSLFHLHGYVANNPVNFTDPYGLWYIDINVSLGYWSGGTAGIIIGPEGIYLYGGGGAVTPPGGVSITWSPDDPSPGWNVGFQAGFWGGFQRGYSFGKDKNDKNWFTEFGFVTPGVSLTGYHVGDCWKWPWRRDWWPWKKR